MDVSIIIVNYNTLQLTKQCIDSVFAQTSGLDFEVILVDNASTDGSAGYFNRDSRIIFVPSSRNLGFGKANNLGYRYAKGDYIFLLNSDTLLLNNAVKHFFDFATNQSDDKVVCWGTVLQDKEGKTGCSYGRFPTVMRFIRQWLNHYTLVFGVNIAKYTEGAISPEEFPKKVDFVSGADLFIKRSVIEKLGLFNPDFFMYYEETEMQKRYSRAGYSSLVITSPKIIHLEGESFRKKRSLNAFRLSVEGSFVYAYNVFSRCSYRLIRILAVVILSPKIIVYPVALREKLLFFKMLFS